MKLCYIILIMFLVLFVQIVGASHQNEIEFRVPLKITTTVGELTTFQMDLKNKGTSVEFYRVTITADPPNQIEITNPSITTKSLKPGETVSVFSNIRTLTETPIALKIQIFKGVLPDEVLIVIPISSKKFSLPEFGMIGFIQIIIISAVVYFLFGNRIKASRQ